MKERILYHIFTEWKYIIRQRRISYRASDISLKNALHYGTIQLDKLEFDEEVVMISWIEKEHKTYYRDSAKASGLRYKFYDYGNEFDEYTIGEIKKFITFLRKYYFFPIRLNVLFCNTQGFQHHIDNHIYYGAFYSMDDEKRRIYPKISIASKITESNSLEDVLCVLAHEITHYYQWYFLEEDKRTDRSLEIEANKWSKYIVESYYNNLSD